MSDSPAAARDYAARLMGILDNDRSERLLTVDDYLAGKHADPYMPEDADAEYRLLARRSVTNLCPLLVATPAQSLYVDSYRRGRSVSDRTEDGLTNTPEWDHFERSGLAARQRSLYEGSIGYGHGFTFTEMGDDGKAYTRMVSPLRASALFDDPANDIIPEAFFEVRKWPNGVLDRKGRADLWIGSTKYLVTFGMLSDVENITVIETGEGNYSENCPATRFAAHLDLEGRTRGVVYPIIPVQDRLNQTIFDLLVAQTYGSFQVRTATGMAPPLKKRAVRAIEGDDCSEVIGFEPVVGKDGEPVYEDMRVTQRRLLMAESEGARFGTLEGTPLDGYISSIEMTIQHMSTLGQIPPNHMLGKIANLSAEALQAAEVSLSRMVEGFRKSFGESWERVFRLAAEIEGREDVAADASGEVLWRDVEFHSMSQVADALGKLADQLGIPHEGLWARVPGATKNEVDEWRRLAREKGDSAPQARLAMSINEYSDRAFRPVNAGGADADSAA